MSNGHGGYRRPNKPAAVSGPGKLSKRTDGGPDQPARYIAGGKYGEGQETMDIQQGAAMSGGSAPPPDLSPVLQRLAESANNYFVGFDKGSMDPDEPETYGSPFGEGPGPEVLSRPTFDDDGEPVPAGADPIADAIRLAVRNSPTPENILLLQKLEAQGR